MDWLEAKAEALGGNLSAALRQTITDARLLEMARRDYKLLRQEHPGFEMPPDEDGASRVAEVALTMMMSEVDDLELRRGEGKA